MEGAAIMMALPGDHAVVFYRGKELASIVGSHLLEALTGGGVSVMVAAPEHALWVSAWLMRVGVDLGAATGSGSYLVLDAQHTMDGFVQGGWPDAAAFWEVISPVLSTASRRRRPVRVFGEMVALLWYAGMVQSAIELEALWNQMARRYSFSLLCAYPAASVIAPQFSDALAQVCEAHTASAGLPPRAGLS